MRNEVQLIWIVFSYFTSDFERFQWKVRPAPVARSNAGGLKTTTTPCAFSHGDFVITPFLSVGPLGPKEIDELLVPPGKAYTLLTDHLITG